MRCLRNTDEVVRAMPLKHVMRTRAALALWLMVGLPLSNGIAKAAEPAPSHYQVIGYASDWDLAQTRDLDKIDTLIFAFAKIEQGRVTLTEDAKRRLARLVKLKSGDPALKVDISIGGWAAGGFSEAASTAAGRAKFAKTATDLVVAHHADGLDIDWEYPGNSEGGIASSPHDRANFTLLLRSVRASLDRAGAANGHPYTLSIAVADGPFVTGIDLAAVNRYVDWFNLMTYDFCNSLTPDTCHHAGLYASKLAPADARTAERAVQQFLAAGVPAHKLVIGAAFYGREFGGVHPEHDGLYQPYAHFIAFVPWSKLTADFIGKHGFVRYWDPQADAPWLWNAKTHTFISYDDPESIAAKAAFVRARQLGGIMYWEQSLDPSGVLLDAIWRGLNPAGTAGTPVAHGSGAR